VRDSVLAGLDLSSARAVLDLGCGFGFMTEAIARRVARDALLVGVDACATNEQVYLARVAATGRAPRFVGQRIEHTLDWPDRSFDLVVASFALYFFPDVLPEVTRVLTPDGLFLGVTHTENSCRDLARLVGLPEFDARLLGLIRNFSAESGSDLLARWFTRIERVDYENSLVFHAAQEDELRTYLRFKLTLLMPDGKRSGELPTALERAAQRLAREGRVVLAKNDVAFRCRQPRCR
jgi:SAM-dependent methyltransferase